MNRKINRRSFTRLTLTLPLARALLSAIGKRESAFLLSCDVRPSHDDELTRRFLDRYQALMKPIREIGLPCDLAPYFVVLAASMNARDEAAHD